MISFSKKLVSNIGLIVLSAGSITAALLARPPETFPKQQFDIHIEKGDSVSSAATNLSKKGIITSPTLFKAAAIILSGNTGVQLGDYRFEKKENTFQIAWRMVRGDQRQPKIRVTIPEGTNTFDMAFILLKNLPNFNAPKFVGLAKKEEGYLYPDTYDFFANTKPEEVIKRMKDNFNMKVGGIEKEIETFGKPLKDIVIMASIVEKEANNAEDRKIISGILWKRLKEGMPLQVDAPFYYITGKLGNFTYNDLKIKSPYNTYLNKGLPIGPITNASLETISDTITPLETPYYYYLTGTDGKMYYSSTYDGHLRNKNIYLK